MPSSKTTFDPPPPSDETTQLPKSLVSPSIEVAQFTELGVIVGRLKKSALISSPTPSSTTTFRNWQVGVSKLNPPSFKKQSEPGFSSEPLLMGLVPVGLVIEKLVVMTGDGAPITSSPAALIWGSPGGRPSAFATGTANASAATKTPATKRLLSFINTPP